MATYETIMSKSAHSGNRAETSVVLEELANYVDCGVVKPAKRILELTTYKYNGAIRASAHACVVSQNTRDDGTTYGIRTMEIFGDFSKRFGYISNKTATAKNVREVHDMALRELDAVVEQAKAFYIAKQAKKAQL